jgi:hypothetical protein
MGDKENKVRRREAAGGAGALTPFGEMERFLEGMTPFGWMRRMRRGWPAWEDIELPFEDRFGYFTGHESTPLPLGTS